jgi:hypothetical protein
VDKFGTEEIYLKSRILREQEMPESFGNGGWRGLVASMKTLRSLALLSVRDSWRVVFSIWVESAAINREGGGLQRVTIQEILRQR